MIFQGMSSETGRCPGERGEIRSTGGESVDRGGGRSNGVKTLLEGNVEVVRDTRTDGEEKEEGSR